MTKTCKRCGLEKPLMEFYKNRHSGDGYRSDCKARYTSIVRRYQATERGQEIARKVERQRAGTDTRKLSHNRASSRYKQTPQGRIVEHAADLRRRERKRGFDTSFSSDDVRSIYERFDHRCFICNSRDRLSIDHHRPLSLGNGLTLTNAVLLCVSCNSAKNARQPEDFYTPEQLEALRGQGVV